MPRINVLVFEVSQSFYAYNLARESVKVAESAFETAQTVRSAVAARVDHRAGNPTGISAGGAAACASAV